MRKHPRKKDYRYVYPGFNTVLRCYLTWSIPSSLPPQTLVHQVYTFRLSLSLLSQP